MKGVDLRQFQFDYDLTWAAIFLHPDGTVLSRYGSRNDSGPMSLNSAEGLTATMERVFDAFGEYPQNRASFVDKLGPDAEYPTVETMPSPTVRELLGATTRRNCIHCHNVHDAQHEIALENGRYDPRKFWKYPLPEQIGLVMDTDSGNRISRVRSNSPASRAGLRHGDVISRMNGQAIFSIADIQFVLHHVLTEPIETQVLRDGKPGQHTVLVGDRWREGNLSWRVSMYNMPPKPRLWVQALDPSAKRKHGIADRALGILIRGVFGTAVKQAGLKQGDLIVKVDGHETAMTEGEFHSAIRLNHYDPGSVMTLTVLRGDERKEIMVRF